MTTFRHQRVTDAEYRVRKLRGSDRWWVTEWYKGERVQLVDLMPTEEEAITLAKRLANRTEF